MTVFPGTAVNLLLGFLCKAFQVRAYEAMLFGSYVVLVFDFLGCDLAFDALVHNSLLLAEDKLLFFLCLLLLGTVDTDRRLCHTLETHRTALVFPK